MSHNARRRLIRKILLGNEGFPGTKRLFRGTLKSARNDWRVPGRRKSAAQRSHAKVHHVDPRRASSVGDRYAQTARKMKEVAK